MAGKKEIWITEYARVKKYPVGGVIYGQHNQGTLVLPYCYGVIRAEGRVVVVDVGFNNENLGKVLADRFGVSDWTPPSTVLGRIGIRPEDVDIVVLTHNHFDHAGNLDAFPNAHVYIQAEEVEKFLWAKTLPDRLDWITTACDPDDLMALMERWKAGKLTLVRGDLEILDGIRVVAAHDTHTLGSQYVVVDDPFAGRWVLAGDNVYVYENIEGIDGDGHFVPIGLLFGSATKQVLAMNEMYELVDGETSRILPFHENKLWERFPTTVHDDGLHTAKIEVTDKMVARR